MWKHKKKKERNFRVKERMLADVVKKVFKWQKSREILLNFFLKEFDLSVFCETTLFYLFPREDKYFPIFRRGILWDLNWFEWFKWENLDFFHVRYASIVVRRLAQRFGQVFGQVCSTTAHNQRLFSLILAHFYYPLHLCIKSIKLPK